MDKTRTTYTIRAFVKARYAEKDGFAALDMRRAVGAPETLEATSGMIDVEASVSEAGARACAAAYPAIEVNSGVLLAGLGEVDAIRCPRHEDGDIGEREMIALMTEFARVRA
jgi:hypothetical protein